MKPLYKWPGGKINEIKYIFPHLPKSFNKYIEPFFGGGGLFFYLENNDNVINELNPELCLFLSLIRDGKSKDIFEGVSKLKNTEEDYYNIRKWEPTTDLEKAIRFYYLRKTCFRGLIRYNKSGKFNVPYGNYKTYNIEDILNEKYEKILKTTHIINEDFSKVFELYNDENDFCFSDPPYHNTFSNYMSDGFNDDRHIELSNLFKKSKMKCLMVIGKTPLIEELYEGYIIEEYGKKYSITRSTKEQQESGVKRSVPNSSHLIIKNY